jgi:hypothetical protein
VCGDNAHYEYEGEERWPVRAKKLCCGHSRVVLVMLRGPNRGTAGTVESFELRQLRLGVRESPVRTTLFYNSFVIVSMGRGWE